MQRKNGVGVQRENVGGKWRGLCRRPTRLKALCPTLQTGETCGYKRKMFARARITLLVNNVSICQ